MGAGLSLLNDLTVIQASQVQCVNHIPPVQVHYRKESLQFVHNTYKADARRGCCAVLYYY